MITSVFLKKRLQQRNKWQHKEVTNVYIFLITLKDLLCCMFIMLNIGKLSQIYFY